MSLMKGNGAYAMTQCYSECFVKRLLFPCANVTRVLWESFVVTQFYFYDYQLVKISSRGFLFCGRS